MLYGAYLSASGIAQEQATQSVIANNLANADTVGFKRLLTHHAHRSTHAGNALDGDPRLAHMTGGSVILPTTLDASQGGVSSTGNRLDLALVGEGFLTVRHDDQTRLTRDGRLTVDDQGTLVLAADPTVTMLDRAGLPIRIPPGTTGDDLMIDGDGTVRDARDQSTLARLQISQPADPQAELRPVGSGLLEFDGPLALLDDAEVRPGYVESSNVEPTTELTRMIASARLLEANANMIKYADSTLGKLIDASAIA
jgi:flagellar basal body rod protein FlgG